MSAVNADQSAPPPARKPRTRRQPQPIQSPTPKASQLEDAAYGRLLERADVKKALFRRERTQAKRDSVSRKLCTGSVAVSVEDLARWETELAAAKESLVALAERSPLLAREAPDFRPGR